MAFVAQDALLGDIDIYAVDNAGAGPFSLVGSSAGKYGRYAQPSVFIDANDPVFGGGIFCYAQVAPFAAQTISSITVSSGTATITTGSAHGLSVGSVIQIAGAVPTGYNGLWTICLLYTSDAADE